MSAQRLDPPTGTPLGNALHPALEDNLDVGAFVRTLVIVFFSGHGRSENSHCSSIMGSSRDATDDNYGI